jgi:hypothetical protein
MLLVADSVGQPCEGVAIGSQADGEDLDVGGGRIFVSAGLAERQGRRGFGPTRFVHIVANGHKENGNGEPTLVNGGKQHRHRGRRAVARGRRMHVQGPPVIPEGSDDSDPDYYYYNDGMGDSDSDDGDIDNSLSVKHLYCSSTWGK